MSCHIRSVEGSSHIPLAELARRVDEIPADRPLVVHCAGGHRSSVAASLLRRRGRTDVSDLLGGYGAWLALSAPAPVSSPARGLAPAGDTRAAGEPRAVDA